MLGKESMALAERADALVSAARAVMFGLQTVAYSTDDDTMESFVLMMRDGLLVAVDEFETARAEAEA